MAYINAEPMAMKYITIEKMPETASRAGRDILQYFLMFFWIIAFICIGFIVIGLFLFMVSYILFVCLFLPPSLSTTFFVVMSCIYIIFMARFYSKTLPKEETLI